MKQQPCSSKLSICLVSLLFDFLVALETMRVKPANCIIPGNSGETLPNKVGRVPLTVGSHTTSSSSSVSGIEPSKVSGLDFSG
ncbi:hypothetical protein BD289DRAFT_138445 [Coniella lustricola]|uniref:Uncharacterized protein n=1 Tax=Coniella lustricola TaxID=2025994 RepID=A0A2T2ZVI7_9PEZI|nr:hypothetical protein BD289DRAFT_138445 [Coniella lustricola]